MDDLSRNTCALLNAAGERIARGRYEFLDEKAWAKFTPASTVTSAQMALATFLWPDGEDRIPITDARPCEGDERHFRLRITPTV